MATAEVKLDEPGLKVPIKQDMPEHVTATMFGPDSQSPLRVSPCRSSNKSPYPNGLADLNDADATALSNAVHYAHFSSSTSS
eukprot:CAMPEP_0177478618 /NCGR_PEP_ID=MMETSP0369-20130122/24794_1 /TAXON_ID=447022 ORGANISM="Scrippsiella hangoei-like, Strain SHHI-4" /NCGR_SAMPLE_ID=MMETSP0369 /ASSEMBLY_ACC=CAM_ASM_000364 /LENGTH=81 /DNA_ID=CAMNT_0018954083 /DNA_START=47 /DNA_END=289 /DNA_ORIENTATION=+